MRRRDFLAGSASAFGLVIPALADASVPSLSGNHVVAGSGWQSAPPMNARGTFIEWMVKNRGEDPNISANASINFSN